MNPLPLGTRVWIAAGVTDMRRGMDSLAAQVQTTLQQSPFSGYVFAFRGRRGDLVKLLWWSGDGMNLYVKRLERGRFVWPQAQSGTVHLSAAQLSMLLEASTGVIRSAPGNLNLPSECIDVNDTVTAREYTNSVHAPPNLPDDIASLKQLIVEQH